MFNICIMVGARPNFVKVAPIIWAVDKAKAAGESVDYKLIYAGCEDDNTLEPSLFRDLQIAPPSVFLGVDCASLNELTGRVMAEFEVYLEHNKTDVVIVVDDLASTMAAAIVTKKRGVRLAHLVAGTRSFDMSMPKEVNRLVIDGLSDYLFTAGIGSNSIVTREGLEMAHIYMVGNILMDTLRRNHSRLSCPALWNSLGLEKGKYILFTLNRKALMSRKDNLGRMIEVMCEAAGNMPVVAPLRGLARTTVEPLAANCPNLQIVEPLSYLEFGYLASNACGIVTDSGNVAEEATFNVVPCATLNSYTEHMETVKVGSNVLVDEYPTALGNAVRAMTGGRWKKSALPERWDGRTAERILKILCNS